MAVALWAEVPFRVHWLPAIAANRPPLPDHFDNVLDERLYLGSCDPEADHIRVIAFFYQFVGDDDHQAITFAIAQPHVAHAKQFFDRLTQTHVHPDRIGRIAGRTVGFVPTMGALHEGHASLIRLARRECGFVVVSIFVNPTQFGPTEDLTRYPRDEAGDLALLESLGIDLAFVPGVAEIYPREQTMTIDVGELGEVLEGAAIIPGKASRNLPGFRAKPPGF